MKNVSNQRDLALPRYYSKYLNRTATTVLKVS